MQLERRSLIEHLKQVWLPQLSCLTSIELQRCPSLMRRRGEKEKGIKLQITFFSLITSCQLAKQIPPFIRGWFSLWVLSLSGSKYHLLEQLGRNSSSKDSDCTLSSAHLTPYASRTRIIESPIISRKSFRDRTSTEGVFWFLWSHPPRISTWRGSQRHPFLAPIGKEGARAHSGRKQILEELLL